jgi:hypothetical protein
VDRHGDRGPIDVTPGPSGTSGMDTRGGSADIPSILRAQGSARTDLTVNPNTAGWLAKAPLAFMSLGGTSVPPFTVQSPERPNFRAPSPGTAWRTLGPIGQTPGPRSL